MNKTKFIHPNLAFPPCTLKYSWSRRVVYTPFPEEGRVLVDPWFRHHLNRTERDATATREAGVNFE